MVARHGPAHTGNASVVFPAQGLARFSQQSVSACLAIRAQAHAHASSVRARAASIRASVSGSSVIGCLHATLDACQRPQSLTLPIEWLRNKRDEPRAGSCLWCCWFQPLAYFQHRCIAADQFRCLFRKPALLHILTISSARDNPRHFQKIPGMRCERTLAQYSV